MSWTEMPMTAFDTETTGPEPSEAKLVTACLAHIDGGAVDSRTWLADPGVEIPEEASAIHGVTTEQARAEGRPLDEVVAEIVTEIRLAWQRGRILVAFNASYDFSLIAAHEPSFTIDGPIIDPFVIDRHWDKYRKGGRQLGPTCEVYGVRADDAHRAEGDALAAARLAWKMPRAYPALTMISAEELMFRQAEWYRERQEDFRKYTLRMADAANRRGDIDTAEPLYLRAEEINTVWPIRGFTGLGSLSATA